MAGGRREVIAGGGGWGGGREEEGDFLCLEADLFVENSPFEENPSGFPALLRAPAEPRLTLQLTVTHSPRALRGLPWPPPAATEPPAGRPPWGGADRAKEGVLSVCRQERGSSECPRVCECRAARRDGVGGRGGTPASAPRLPGPRL